VLPVHFYHLHADGWWAPAVREHFNALRESAFPGEVFVGLVGTPANRADVLGYLAVKWPGARLAYQADLGYEQPTIAALQAHAITLDPETPVLYAHTKGTARISPEQAPWRECMTKRVVRDWQACAALLEGHDAVGPHWTGAYFSGNFWVARAGYLAGLPPIECPPFVPDDLRRAEAETWIAAGQPDVVDVCDSCKIVVIDQ
jgi:hypothetical protein